MCPFNLINKRSFPYIYDPTLVEIHQSIWKFEPNVNPFSWQRQPCTKWSLCVFPARQVQAIRTFCCNWKNFIHWLRKEYIFEFIFYTNVTISITSTDKVSILCLCVCVCVCVHTPSSIIDNTHTDMVYQVLLCNVRLLLCENLEAFLTLLILIYRTSSLVWV